MKLRSHYFFSFFLFFLLMLGLLLCAIISNKLLLLCLLGSIVFIAFYSYLLKNKKITLPFVYHNPAGSNYTLATLHTSYPLNIDVHAVDIIDPTTFRFSYPFRFMADPFIVEEAGMYYLFFEQFHFQSRELGADIALLSSKDLKNWRYEGFVLKESFHLSYPQVFKYENVWYMIPESGAVNEVRLYSTQQFPFKWKQQNVLLTEPIADATLLIRDGVFYLLGMLVNDNSLRLYCSDSLSEGWSEHPCSPIRVEAQNGTRPAGRIEELDGKLIYLVQDNSQGYGTGVIAYQIDEISTHSFKDHRLENNPILFKFGEDWAMNGMHHLTYLKLKENEYFCVVDGLGPSKYYKWRFSLKNFPRFI